MVRNADGKRVPAQIRLVAPDTGKTLAEGTTYDDTHDMNDHLVFIKPEKTMAVIMIKQPDGKFKEAGFTTFEAKQKLVELKLE